jgi:uncharacterized repeat protein (TIGR03803 family)
MTTSGGANGAGTIFKLTPGGTLTTLYSFCSQAGCPDGESPYNEAGLVQATNGDFYGTTGSGGANGNGTIFKITPSGTLTTLYSFCSQAGCTDGSYPGAPVIQATDGDFYGTTSSDGANHGGTVFKITPSGTLTTLYSFCSQAGCTDGNAPQGALVQATNGDFCSHCRCRECRGCRTRSSVSPLCARSPDAAPKTCAARMGLRTRGSNQPQRGCNPRSRW